MIIILVWINLVIAILNTIMCIVLKKDSSAFFGWLVATIWIGMYIGEVIK